MSGDDDDDTNKNNLKRIIWLNIAYHYSIKQCSKYGTSPAYLVNHLVGCPHIFAPLEVDFPVAKLGLHL